MSGNSANLDFLRASAVLTVYFAHLLKSNRIDDVGFLNVHNFAQTGVLIFFVHTSLVLMLSMDRTRATDLELASAFYIRRAFRIYPLSIVAVLVAALFRVPGFPTRTYEWMGWPGFWSNFSLIQNLTLSKNILDPLWSLPVELQMYLVLPPLFFLLRRYRGWWLPVSLWCCAVVIASVLLYKHASPRFSLGYFAPCFLGGLVAFVLLRYRTLRLPFWGWPLVIAGAYAIRQMGFQSGWVGCLLLGLAAPQFQELSNRAVRAVAAWVARYSYGIYLSHVVIFWITLVVLRNSHLVVKISVCALLSVVVPVVLYHTIEKPMINVGVRVANSMALWPATVASRPALAGAPDSMPAPDVDVPASPAP